MKSEKESLIFAAGAVISVLAVLPYKLFDLDRFFIPKELAVHIFAALMAVTAIRRVSVVKAGISDAALALYLVLSFLSMKYGIAASGRYLRAAGRIFCCNRAAYQPVFRVFPSARPVCFRVFHGRPPPLRSTGGI